MVVASFYVVMFQSCVRSYKGYLNGFFFVVRGNSSRGFSGIGNLYSTDARTTLPKASDSAQKPTATTRKHKSDSGPIITLIGTDNNPSVVPLSDAEKIAKRRDLKLVRIVDLDTKTQRPIYQLMTGAQYYTEDRKLRKEKSAKKGSGFKGDKLVTLSHRITPHDISSKLKNVTKWLSKTYEVRVVINGDNGNMNCAVSVQCKVHLISCSLVWRELESFVNDSRCEEVNFEQTNEHQIILKILDNISEHLESVGLATICISE
jgi:translation initiation factor IF-3